MLHAVITRTKELLRTTCASQKSGYGANLMTPHSAEHEFDHRKRVIFFEREISDQDAPCAVCQYPYLQLLMIPGRNKCLDGWTLEYKGHLVAGDIPHAAASELICLDANRESPPNDSLNTDGKLFYVSNASCGRSLKCSP
ncbi:hypothetical protein DPMN_027826 [Dreissena polymorpha]|uniref:Uncharacterized protein n=1 Tax=Dreissena polymorpha TaxID=45954 RepID=A0A9D4LTM0_DREPO|nr:hypothetical protein DPMN_027826 [Dreissena polymorpha]